MWHALPDVFSPDWFAAVRDVLSVGLAALGAWLAWKSIRMSEANEAVTAKQMDLMAGQKELLAELKALEGKQAEIAEAQHRLVVEDRSRKVALEAQRVESSSGWHDDATHKYEHSIYVANGGDRVTREVHWKIRIPHHFVNVTMSAAPGNTVLRHGGTFEVHDEKTMDIEEFTELSGRYDGPVYPDQQVRVAELVQLLPHPIGAGDKLDELQWALECAEGRYPASGFTALWLGFGRKPEAAANPVGNPGQPS